MKLADTSFLIDLLRNRIKKEKITIINTDVIVTTRINLYEVLLGVYRLDPEKRPKKLDDAKSLFNSLKILELDEKSCIKSAEIRSDLIKEGRDINDLDCLIAGISIENGISTILTKNKKHFERVPGINIEEY